MTAAQKFQDYFREATSRITILGANPLHPHLEDSGQFFADLLVLNPNLELTILVESDSENFSQSLCVDHSGAENRISYATLRVHRDRVLGRKKKGEDGLVGEIQRALRADMNPELVLNRVAVRQSNLRHPVNLIQVDETLWYAITGSDMPDITSYVRLEPDSSMTTALSRMLNWYLSSAGGAKFLSDTGDELIQLYDKDGYPRGIYPRLPSILLLHNRLSALTPFGVSYSIVEENSCYISVAPKQRTAAVSGISPSEATSISGTHRPSLPPSESSWKRCFCPKRSFPGTSGPISETYSTLESGAQRSDQNVFSGRASRGYRVPTGRCFEPSTVKAPR